MVFPEGVKGTGKPFSERYRLQRFGRGGFVEVALRTGAPIVPVAVVGSEEIYPKIAREPDAGQGGRGSVRPDHPDVPLARAARPDPAALPLADRVLRADRPLRVRPRRGRRPPRGLRRLRAGARDDPAEALREPGQAPLGVPVAPPPIAGSAVRVYGRPMGSAVALKETTVAIGRLRRGPSSGSCSSGSSSRSTATSGSVPLLRAADIRVRFHYPDLDTDAERRRHRRGRPPPEVGVLRRHRLDAEARARDGLRRRQPLPPGTGEPGGGDRPRRVQGPRRHRRSRCSTCPALRLVCEPYRRSSATDYPHLAIA